MKESVLMQTFFVAIFFSCGSILEAKELIG
jgi:hypothetical protein